MDISGKDIKDSQFINIFSKLITLEMFKFDNSGKEIKELQSLNILSINWTLGHSMNEKPDIEVKDLQLLNILFKLVIVGFKKPLDDSNNIKLLHPSKIEHKLEV